MHSRISTSVENGRGKNGIGPFNRSITANKLMIIYDISLFEKDLSMETQTMIYYKKM